MATIYDVARSAGVSAKTVSRVLNGDAPVGRATRENVERAISDLGYVPSSAARTLRSNRSGLIGVVSGAISHSAESPDEAGLPEIHIVRGIQDVLTETGRTVLLADAGDDLARAPGLIRTLAAHRVDGIVHVAPYHQRVALAAVPGIPLAIANGYDAAGTPSAVPDDHAGQLALVRGLIARGHRRIAYLQLPEELDATRLRTAAYLEAHAEAGLAADPALVCPADRPGARTGARAAAVREAVSAVLARPDPPTAICCGNDRIAVAVYGLLRARGLRIPEDVSVAGYDDHRLITETLHPQLTSVELPYRAIGRRAARLLTDPDPPAAPVLVGGEVRWRGSVAPIASQEREERQ